MVPLVLNSHVGGGGRGAERLVRVLHRAQENARKMKGVMVWLTDPISHRLSICSLRTFRMLVQDTERRHSTLQQQQNKKREGEKTKEKIWTHT